MAPQITSKQRKDDKTSQPKRVDVLAQKGANTRGTKGEQMRTDPEAHGLVVPSSKKSVKKKSVRH